MREEEGIKGPVVDIELFIDLFVSAEQTEVGV